MEKNVGGTHVNCSTTGTPLALTIPLLNVSELARDYQTVT